MNLQRTIILTVLIFVFASIAQADIIAFDSNATITEPNSYDIVVVKGNGTVVDMTSGNIDHLILMNASTFNMYGGNIGHDNVSYDSSILNVWDGYISKASCCGQSRINIYDTTSESLDIITYGSSMANVSGGAFSSVDLEAKENSELIVSSTNVGSISLYHNATCDFSGSADYIYLGGNNRLNVNGGTIGEIDLGGSDAPKPKYVDIVGGTVSELLIDSTAIVTVSGGSIDSMEVLILEPDSVPNWLDPLINVRIVGYDLEATPYGGVDETDGQVTGYWIDDTPFSINLEEGYAYGYLTLYDGVIPQDCISWPEGDINRDCKVNFNDFALMAGNWLDCNLDPPETCWP